MRVGSKSMNFIMHKPFHPGNLQNLEKVWLAEQNDQREKQQQKELMERRRQEMQIEELRKAIRKQTDALAGVKESELNRLSGASLPAGLVKKSKAGNIQMLEQNLPKPCINSVFTEDVHPGEHSTVYGSWFDIETKLWGFRCCKQTDKTNLKCSAFVAINSETQLSELEQGRARKKQKLTNPKTTSMADCLRFLRSDNFDGV
eukprot:Filipodium_phascolosomae@DN2479_c0_g1_i1.p1